MLGPLVALLAAWPSVGPNRLMSVSVSLAPPGDHGVAWGGGGGPGLARARRFCDQEPYKPYFALPWGGVPHRGERGPRPARASLRRRLDPPPSGHSARFRESLH